MPCSAEDIFAATPTDVKEKEAAQAAQAAGAAVAAAHAKKGLLDSYDDHEGYYNFQVGGRCEEAAGKLGSEVAAAFSSERACRQRKLKRWLVWSTNVSVVACGLPARPLTWPACRGIAPPLCPLAGGRGDWRAWIRPVRGVRDAWQGEERLQQRQPAVQACDLNVAVL